MQGNEKRSQNGTVFSGGLGAALTFTKYCRFCQWMSVAISRSCVRKIKREEMLEDDEGNRTCSGDPHVVPLHCLVGMVDAIRGAGCCLGRM